MSHRTPVAYPWSWHQSPAASIGRNCLQVTPAPLAANSIVNRDLPAPQSRSLSREAPRSRMMLGLGAQPPSCTPLSRTEPCMVGKMSLSYVGSTRNSFVPGAHSSQAPSNRNESSVHKEGELCRHVETKGSSEVPRRAECPSIGTGAFSRSASSDQSRPGSLRLLPATRPCKPASHYVSDCSNVISTANVGVKNASGSHATSRKPILNANANMAARASPTLTSSNSFDRSRADRSPGADKRLCRSSRPDRSDVQRCIAVPLIHFGDDSPERTNDTRVLSERSSDTRAVDLRDVLQSPVVSPRCSLEEVRSDDAHGNKVVRTEHVAQTERPLPLAEATLPRSPALSVVSDISQSQRSITTNDPNPPSEYGAVPEADRWSTLWAETRQITRLSALTQIHRLEIALSEERRNHAITKNALAAELQNQRAAHERDVQALEETAMVAISERDHMKNEVEQLKAHLKAHQKELVLLRARECASSASTGTMLHSNDSLSEVSSER